MAGRAGLFGDGKRTARKAWTAGLLAAPVLVGLLAGAAAMAAPGAGASIVAPMVCSRGSGQHFYYTTVSVPRAAVQGATYDVRIDGVPSGAIKQFGLNYTHDAAVDYVVPAGATYVEGSAHVVPGTGTANVATGARVWYEAGLLKTTLPGRVDSGTGYTPPSIEFQLTASAPVGASLAVEFSQYRVMANAVIVGDVSATCDPTPKPYKLGVTMVTAPAPAPTPSSAP